jgi:predicted GTPase
VLLFEGSGSAIPPVEVDRTLCIAGDRAVEDLGAYRLLRADLILMPDFAQHEPIEGVRFALRPEPAEPLPANARVALFTTGAPNCEGVEPVVASENLARRSALEADLERAAAEGCDLYLTELKAAAIDTVAVAARAQDARVVFVCNRPVGLDGDLDEALVNLYDDVA